MPTSARRARCRTREGRGDRSEAEGAARLGRREVRLLCCAGWDSKGQSRGRRTTTQGPQVANKVSGRGPQRVARALATGALAVLTADPRTIGYKRATGALAGSLRTPITSLRDRSTAATHSSSSLYSLPRQYLRFADWSPQVWARAGSNRNQTCSLAFARCARLIGFEPALADISVTHFVRPRNGLGRVRTADLSLVKAAS